MHGMDTWMKDGASMMMIEEAVECEWYKRMSSFGLGW